MFDIIFETIIDSIKLLPFLFLTFLLMELLEHKFDSKQINFLKKGKKFEPIIGAFLGAIPHFSASVTNLYITRVITLGTLIAVFLSTSDEMLPVMISSGVDFKFILAILLIKITIGLVCGVIIDLFIQQKHENNIKEFCNHKHCECENNIFLSSLSHTIKTIMFIFIITLLFNILVEKFDESILEQTFMKDNILGLFIMSIIGLIPSCASSILIVEMYLKNVITLGSMFSGILTGSGVGLLVLFKENRNLKENLMITFLLVFIGILFGFIIDFII